jgi:predicted nucleotidyltransferase
MFLTKENIITVLRKEKTALRNDLGVQDIALFGSYAKNKQREESDIDFLVEQMEVNYNNLYKTLIFIEQKFPGKKIQLTRKGPHLSEKFLKSIEEDLIHV